MNAPGNKPQEPIGENPRGADRRAQEVTEVQEVTEALPTERRPGQGETAEPAGAAFLAIIPQEERADYEKKLREMPAQLRAQLEGLTAEAVKALLKAAEEAQTTGGDLEAVAAGFNLALADAKVNSFLQAATVKQLRGILTGVVEWIREVSPQFDIAPTGAFGDKGPLLPLMPYIAEEVEAYKAAHGLKELSMQKFMQNYDPQTKEPIESIFEKVLQRAAERAKDGTEAEAAAAEKLLKTAAGETTGGLIAWGIKPEYLTMPNNALINALQQKPAINAGAFDLVVSNPKGKRGEITAYTIASYDFGEASAAMPFSLTEYQRCVSDAITSLWLDAMKKGLPPIVTTNDIHRAMPGGSNEATPRQAAAIAKAVDFLSRLWVSCDTSEEMRVRGKPASPIEGNYIQADKKPGCRVRQSRRKADAYLIYRPAIDLEYSQTTGQLLTVPAKYYRVEKIKRGATSGELVTMNADRQAMTSYMLRRIFTMKRSKRAKAQTQSNVILFDTLFARTGTQTDDRKQTMLNRSFCFDVLDYWKAVGFINGYKQQKKGRTITGIIIEL